MTHRGFLAAALLFCLNPVYGSGMAYNENFVVTADDKPLAEAVLQKAGQFRKEVAEEWLEEELPPSIGRAMIDVRISDADEGKTWIIDHPDRTYHLVWLNTSRERALGSMLRHEITHVVFATEMPSRLPAWADEGAASLSDDTERAGIRRRTLAWYHRTGNWPNLKKVLETNYVSASNTAVYSVAASITEYLLTLGDKPTFLKFAIEGKNSNWDRALHRFYGIQNVGDLEQRWRSWLVRELKKGS